jgi:hypothetical protein
MDSLLQLSAIACEQERLNEMISISSSEISSSTLTTSSPSENISPPLKDPPIARCFPHPGSSLKRYFLNILFILLMNFNFFPFFPCLCHRPSDQVQDTDRSAIREKIRSAFAKKAQTYEELLNLCVSLTEDQIFNEAPSKLDYYKQGISMVKKVFDKSALLQTNPNEEICKLSRATSSDDLPRVVKRAKTQH